MTYEVELKFVLPDASALEGELATLGAVRGEPLEQVDRYFAHPIRDFKETDEALRIRSAGRENFITYKGPRFDAATKSRPEIEVPLAIGDRPAAELCAILERLGFRPVREVHKMRVPYDLRWDDRCVELAIDQVDGLGQFCELETLATDSDRDEARDCILSLAKRLGLENVERGSYLGLLLDRDAAASSSEA